MEKTSRKWGLLIIGTILLAFGLFGFYDRLVYGHSHANYGTIIPWGLWVVLYIYFMGLSAGCFLFSWFVHLLNINCLARLGRLPIFTALIAVLLALLFVWADVGHLDRVWHLFVYPNLSSPMAWATWIYAIYASVLAVLLWLLLRHDFDAADGAKDGGTRTIAAIGIPLATGVAVGAGIILGTISARSHWHSGMYPILFLLSALISGGGFLTAIVALYRDKCGCNKEATLKLGKILLGLLLVEVLFQSSEMLIALYGNVPSHVEGLKLVISGPFWWVFWVWQITLGTLVPIAILTLPTRKNFHWVGLAGLTASIGVLATRLNLVLPGLAVEEIPGLSKAIASARMATDYFPSASEISLAFGVLGLGILLFGFGTSLFPIFKETWKTTDKEERA